MKTVLPTYVQISEMLIRDIAAGRYLDGARLPPERQMAAELEISVGTLRKALDDMNAKGLLEKRQGSGNYVKTGATPNSVYSFFRVELIDGGGLPTAQVLNVGLLPKPAAFPAFGPAPKAGERFKRPDMVGSLQAIRDSEGEAFYRGELGAAMVAASTQAGGVLTREDLANHTCDWVTPIRQSYRGVELLEIPPNGQGLAAQIALGILGYLPAAELDSVALIHQQIEAMKIAVHAANEHFADERAMYLTPEQLLAPGSLERAAKRIGDRAAPLPPVSLPVGEDTVYLTTADSDGMMVSFIQSNFRAFGSGIVIPGTGIAMQNRGSGFSLDPAHANCVGPSKRPFHTLIPGFVTQGGRPVLSFGVMGGHMQHQGHLQVVSRIFDYGQNPQEASDAPRWHVYPDLTVGLERGMPQSVFDGLKARGHDVRYERLESVFGGAQLIQSLPSGYVGASDHRKEGYVGGF